MRYAIQKNTDRLTDIDALGAVQVYYRHSKWAKQE